MVVHVIKCLSKLTEHATPRVSPDVNVDSGSQWCWGRKVLGCKKCPCLVGDVAGGLCLCVGRGGYWICTYRSLLSCGARHLALTRPHWQTKNCKAYLPVDWRLFLFLHCLLVPRSFQQAKMTAQTITYRDLYLLCFQYSQGLNSSPPTDGKDSRVTRTHSCLRLSLIQVTSLGHITSTQHFIVLYSFMKWSIRCGHKEKWWRGSEKPSWLNSSVLDMGVPWRAPGRPGAGGRTKRKI